MSDIPGPTSAAEALRMILALLASIDEPRYINPTKEIAALGLAAERNRRKDAT